MGNVIVRARQEFNTQVQNYTPRYETSYPDARLFCETDSMYAMLGIHIFYMYTHVVA
jgi:hypothetical protein